MSNDEKNHVHAFQTTHKNDFFFNLDEMRTNEIFTDIILVCKDQEFHAHQLVLSVASPHFRKMFETNDKESTSRRLHLDDAEGHILKAVLNFIYSSSKHDILHETFEDLLRIHSLSQLYRVKNLQELSWTIINERMKAKANVWPLVWKEALQFYNRMGNPTHIQKLITFFLEKIQEIVKQESFLNLQMTEIKQLVEKIQVRDKKKEESLLNAIMKWVKAEKERINYLSELILCFDFNFISEEKLKEILNDKDSCFEDEFFKIFLQLQLTSNVKLEHVLQEILAQSSSQSEQPLPSVSFFYFGKYRNHSNDGQLSKEYPALWILDLQNRANVKLQFLPFKVNDRMLYTKSRSNFYFLDPSNIETTSGRHFFSYNGETNEVNSEPSPPQSLENAHMCCVEDKVYLIGLDSEHYLIISYFEINKQEWKYLSKYYKVSMISAVVPIKDEIFIFGREFPKTRGLSLYHVKKYSCTYPLTSSEYEQLGMSSKMNTVYKNKIYRFFKSGRYSYYVHDSNGHYTTYTNDCLKSFPLKYCFSTESEGIFFYNSNNELLHFEKEKNEMKKRIYFYPFIKSSQFISDKKYRFSYEIFAVCPNENI